jgi:gliding motility-associated-like protein
VQVFHNITKIIPAPAQLCLGDSIQLTTDSSFVKYVWSTGVTASAIEASRGGQYYVNTVDKHGCKGEDTVNVQVFTKLVLNLRDTSICFGHEAFLRADSGNYAYVWTPANSLNSSEIWDPIADPSKTTTYTVIATNGPCVTRDSVTVTVFPTPHVTATPDSSMIIYGQSVTLTASGDSAYEWFPSKWLSCTECATTVATPDSNMVYYVSVKNKYGCSASDTVLIDIEPTLYIPSAFTPNGDGLNDIFRPQFTGYTSMEVYIFDRWGELLYHWNTLDGGWDGRFKGTLVQEDVYVYMLKATTYTRQTVQKIGSVTLLR